MSKPRVVLTHWVHPEVLELLDTHCRVVANQTRHTLPREEVLARAREAEGLMVFMPDRIDAEFLRQCPRLKVIGAALKGYDNLDAAACSAAGVWLAIVPDLLTAPTAELAVALLLGLLRRLPEGARLVRGGGFSGWRPILYGTSLQESGVGLLGFGAVGRAVARRLAGFEAQLLYHDPKQASNADEVSLGVTWRSLPELLGESDVLLVSAPLTSTTRHLLDRQALALMKPGAYLINVGRGSVVEEAAVAEALQQGRLAGFAADVFEFEDWALPKRPAGIHPGLLAQPDRTLFTPHLGSAVDRARRDITLAAAENLLSGLAGRRPPGAVNELL